MCKMKLRLGDQILVASSPPGYNEVPPGALKWKHRKEKMIF